jgi:hypothetical protein
MKSMTKQDRLKARYLKTLAARQKEMEDSAYRYGQLCNEAAAAQNALAKATSSEYAIEVYKTWEATNG